MGKPSRYYTEAPYLVTKTIAFTGAAGNGAVGTVTIFNITGQVLLLYCFGTCSESLAGATATITLETSDGRDIIATTTATDLLINEIWTDATPTELGSPLETSQKDIGLNGGASGQTIVLTVGTANVTDGTLTIHALYYPMSSDGELAAA